MFHTEGDMRISYNWLKDYVDIKMAPEKLCGILTMSGLPVESMETKGGDSIFELEVTSNRPDALSVIGVAREVAAITGKKLHIPSTAHGPQSTVRKQGKISIKVVDKKLCPRYTGRVMEGVKVAGSPKWLREKIEAIGLRPVNNIVDITNFCLFETGEPMHAFDLDRIKGGSVSVRRAAKGEKIRTIDGVERALDETILVIADKERPVAIAGIMGGLDTEVTSSTRNILLEAAIFDPISVRRAARKFGISTESSYRFERKIDPASVSFASMRAASLILKEAGGNERYFVDTGTGKAKTRSAALNYSRLNKILGVDIPSAKVKKLLASLGFKAKISSKDSMTLEIPSFRQDVKDEIDLVEEAARILGYGKIPLALPKVPENFGDTVPFSRTVEARVRDILTSSGTNEILTYSLLSRKDIKSADLSDEAVVSVANPLSAEQEAMRPSLVPGLLKAVAWNINRKAKEIGLFEIGNIYPAGGAKPFGEVKRLSIGLSGEIRGSWQAPSRQADFFDLKGMLETLAEGLGLKGIELSSAGVPFLEEGSSAAIKVKDGPAIGFIGEASRAVLDAYDIKQKVYALEISLDDIFKLCRFSTRYEEPPRYPSAVRDLSIIVDKSVECASIVNLIRASGGAIVKGLELIDRYSGKQIPDGRIGFTYRIEYQDPSKTLEDARVNAAHSEIFNTLAEKLGARIR